METIERPLAQPIKYKGKKEFIDTMLPYVLQQRVKDLM